MPTSVSANDLASLWPLFILLGTGIVVLMLDLFVERKPVLAYVSLAGLVVAAVSCFGYWRSPRTAFGGAVTIDNFFVFFAVLSIISGIVAILMSLDYIAEEGPQTGEYYPLLVFTTLGMVLLVAASDLIVVFLAVELLSIGLYVLTGMARHRAGALEASFKYFLLGSFSFGFFVYGAALVYGATGTTNFASLATALNRPDTLSNPLVVIGGGLILVGFAFKLAFVPFHMWTPDVYEGAPTPITAFMSVGTKAATFAALVRVALFALPSLQPNWAAILWALAIATMVWGNVAAVIQSNVKRMLAYSSIAQAGYILVGLIAAGRDNADGVAAVGYYLLVYLVMNIGAFAVVAALSRRGSIRGDLSDFTGLASRNPGLAAMMAIFMLALAGVPPTAGFMGKLYVFGAAVQSGYVDLALIGVLTSAISAFYYLGVIVTMYMREAPADLPAVIIPSALLITLVMMTAMTVVLGVVPAPAIFAAQDIINQPLVPPPTR